MGEIKKKLSSESEPIPVGKGILNMIEKRKFYKISVTKDMVDKVLRDVFNDLEKKSRQFIVYPPKF